MSTHLLNSPFAKSASRHPATAHFPRLSGRDFSGLQAATMVLLNIQLLAGHLWSTRHIDFVLSSIRDEESLRHRPQVLLVVGYCRLTCGKGGVRDGDFALALGQPLNAK